MNTLPAPASSWEAVAAALFAKDCGGDESDGTRSATPDSENSDAENIDFVSRATTTTTTTMMTRGNGGPTSSVLSYAATNGRQVREWTLGSRGESMRRKAGEAGSKEEEERRFFEEAWQREGLLSNEDKKSNLFS